MEIPEIQYQPGQVSSNVAPVEQVDVTQGLRENQARTAQQMQDNLAQMQKNAGIQLQNVRDQAFPVEELAKFSQTAANIMDEKVETMKVLNVSVTCLDGRSITTTKLSSNRLVTTLVLSLMRMQVELFRLTARWSVLNQLMLNNELLL
jgi:hypothetical protein